MQHGRMCLADTARKSTRRGPLFEAGSTTSIWVGFMDLSMDGTRSMHASRSTSQHQSIVVCPSWMGRMVQGLGATSTIMALFLVNLIGYTMGIAGTRDLVDNIARDGQIASAVSFAVLFSGVQASRIRNVGNV